MRQLASDRVEALSAGASPAGYVHPLAIKVMAEAGIDISGESSKSIEDFLEDPPDLIVSVCDSAVRRCPVFPGGGVERVHWPFDDPAGAEGSEEERLAVFRRASEAIRIRIVAELTRLVEPNAGP